MDTLPSPSLPPRPLTKGFSLFRWFRDVSIAKKLYFTVGAMALLIGVELLALFFCLNTLSALRAYVGGEGLWSKAQKDAVFHLYRYGVSGNEEDYLLFLDFMKVPIGDSKARAELLGTTPDLAKARQGFLEGRNHPDDVDGMIGLFRRFSDVYYISKAIAIWGEAEPIAMQLIPIAEGLRAEMTSASPGEEKIATLLHAVSTVNNRLTAFEDDFSYTLGEGSRWLEGVVLRLLFITALTVEITGLVLAISVSRGIQKGLKEIIRAAQCFAKGSYSTRAKVFSRDEIGMVAKAYNQMSDDLEYSILELEHAEKRFRMLLECAPDVMIIADNDGRIKLINAQTKKLFGYQSKELLDQPIELLLSKRFREHRLHYYTNFFDFMKKSADGTALDFFCRKKNGEEFPVEISFSPLETEEGLLVSAAIRDISERSRMIVHRIEAEEALREAYDELQLRVGELAATNRQLRHEIDERERAETELQRAFAMLEQHVNNTPLAVIEWEHDGSTRAGLRVRRWSPRAESIFGWSKSEVFGRSPDEFSLVYEGDAPRAAAASRDLTEGRCPHNSLGLRCYTKDRAVRHCQWYNSALRPEGSSKVTILSQVEDVTERVSALEEVYRLAHHDTLTGLPNRITLHDRLGQALALARRHGERVAVMILDLDHFKNVNDALGHPVGDELLQQVAERFRAHLRDSDTLARVGGDEFVIVQPGLAGQDQHPSPRPWRQGASVLARKLIEALAEPFDVAGNRLHIGSSIGLTIFPEDGSDPDILLRNADLALYRAKHEGRGHYRYYTDDMDLELRASRSIEEGLRQAMAGDGLDLFYQPAFTLGTEHFGSVEALIRWPHPGGGDVSPARFIPIAESSGLIAPLGEWIMRQACAQVRAWADAGVELSVSVNVSAVQLRQPNFAGLIADILKEARIPTSALEIEVTESVFLDPSKVLIARTLADVADLGVRLAIDDFGTGYSSLAYLKHFPFHRIKIDASFVHDIGIKPDTEAIIKAIIALGHSLGKTVTAEGVETPRQLAFLCDHDCDEAQGYLFAKPDTPAGISRLSATAKSRQRGMCV